MRWALAGGLALAVVLAGCASAPRPRLPEGCDPTLYADCPAEGAWRFLPLDIECRPSQSETYGLNTFVKRSVVLEGFSIRGCDQPLVLWGCPACDLTLRNGTVAAAGRFGTAPGEFDANLVLGDRAAIVLRNPWGRVVLENVTVQAPAGFHGLQFHSESIASVAVDGLRLEGPGGDNRTVGLNVRALDLVPAVCLSGVQAAGFGVGVVAAGKRLDLRGARLSGNVYGAVLGAFELDAADVEAGGNDVGLHVATGRLETGGPLPPPLSLRDVRLGRNGVGIDVAPARAAILEGIVAEGNGVAVNAGDFTTIVGSSFSGSAVAAVQTHPLESDEAGNSRPFGPVDAAGNWWGDPAGPTMRAGPVRTPGNGDAVGPGVLFVPFLDAPPQVPASAPAPCP